MLVDRAILPSFLAFFAYASSVCIGKLGIPQEQVSTSPMDETLEMTLRRCWALERLNHVAMDSIRGSQNPKNDQPW